LILRIVADWEKPDAAKSETAVKSRPIRAKKLKAEVIGENRTSLCKTAK
jgi:hypothetical protein